MTTLYFDSKKRIEYHLARGNRDEALGIMHDLHAEQPESAEVLREAINEKWGEWLE